MSILASEQASVWQVPTFINLATHRLIAALGRRTLSREARSAKVVGMLASRNFFVSKSALWLVLLCSLLAMTSALAQEGPQAKKPVMVGLFISPPFVMQEQNRFTGMAVELWESIAGSLGIQSQYRPFPTIRALIDATANGEVDVAVTNLTITQGRAQRIDFTHPWFDAGQRIMVNERQGTRLLDVVAGLRDAGFLRAYAWLAFVIVAATISLTIFDRKFDPAFPRRWRDGAAESFFSIMSVAAGKASGRRNIFGWVGRIWQGLWLMFGIAVLAYVTSSVTSVMTTLSLTNQIDSLADLPGKSVGVFTGSVSEDFARDSGFDRQSFANIDEAVAGLHDGRIDAIIGDAPVLEYYAHNHPEGRVDVVGGLFEPDKYGFGLARNSPLTRQLTVEILGAHEHGVVEGLHAKYFGEAP